MLTWKAHDAAVFDLAFTPDGRLITSADDATRLWDVASQAELNWWSAGHAVNLAISPDGRWIAGAGSGQFWEWEVDGNIRKLLRGQYEGDFATYTPDARFVVIHGGFNHHIPGGFDHQLYRSAVQGEESGGWGGLRTGHWQSSGPLAFSPDGQLLATLDKPGFAAILLRTADCGGELKRLFPSIRTPRATRLSFSPDSKLLASIHGPTLVLWDMTSRTEYGRGRVANKRFTGLAFTAEGSRLLTASGDRFLRVWTAPTWEQTITYKWDAGKLGCVAVSADGTLAAAGGSTGKVVVWDLD